MAAAAGACVPCSCAKQQAFIDGSHIRTQTGQLAPCFPLTAIMLASTGMLLASQNVHRHTLQASTTLVGLITL